MLLLQSDESLSLYLPPEPGEPGDPWMGFLLPEEAPVSIAGRQMALSYAWAESQGYFVFSPRAPASQSAFVVTAWSWLAENGYRPSGPMRPYLIWVEDPDAPPKSFSAGVIEIGATAGGSGRVEANANLYLGSNYVLSVRPNVVVKLVEGEAPALSLTSFEGLAFKANNPVLAKTSNANIPLTGPRRGCLCLEEPLTVQGPQALSEEALDLAIRYFAPDESEPESPQRFRYPLFSLPGRSDSIKLEAVLDPARPTDPQRTSLTLPPQPAIASWLRTPRGQAISLQPGQGARLLLAPLPSPPGAAAALYAVPDGLFTTAVVGGGQAVAGFGSPAEPGLVCGSSGTETLSLPAGTTLEFKAGSPAMGTFDPRRPAATGIGEYLEATSGLTTAWVSVGGAQQVVYRAQPQEAPLFQAPAADSADSSPTLLSPLPLQLWPDPSHPPPQPQPSPPAPIVPLAGIPATADAEEFATYAEMDARLLALARRQELLAAAESVRGRGGGPPTAEAEALWTTEPHGMLVEVDAASERLEKVRLGVSPTAQIQASRAARRGAPSAAPLAAGAPGELDLARVAGDPLLALQSERVFLVATQEGSSAEPRLQFEGGIDLNGWTFAPALPAEAEKTLAPTATVMIVKLGGETLSTLVDRLWTWQDAAVYNRSPEEAQSLVQAKIAQARADVAEKKEASLFADFVRLVDDPSWNGALILNCGIGEVPAAIESVLIGIPSEQFVAFHLAVQTSDVEAVDGSLKMLRSAVSALVDYENPEPGKGVVMDTPRTHGFLVNYLRAQFANSSLTSFACQVGLELDELFGLGLVVHDGGQPPPPNLLILNGVYQAQDDDPASGKGSYSFVGLPATQFDFDYRGLQSVPLRVLESMTVSKIQLAPVSRDAEKIVSSFSFWGSLTFGKTPGIDLFNYESLVFSNLALLMTAPAPGQGAQVPSFALSTTATGFDSTVVPGATDRRANKVRAGGLVGSLPLTPTKLLNEPEPGGMTLAKLGFKLLQPIADNSPTVKEETAVETALVYDLPLGGFGAFAPAAPLSAQILAGWTPAGELLLGLSLLSLGDGSQLRLEEVLRLGLGDAALDLVELASPGAAAKSTTVALLIEGVSLRLLGTTLPKSPVSLTFTILAPTPGAGVLWSARYPLPATKGREPDRLEAAR